MQKKRLVIADDHRIIRDGLRSMFESTKRFEVVGEAEDGLETIRTIQKCAPDLLILDLSMPKLSGLSVLHDIRTRFPAIKIIVLTVHDSEEYFKEVFKAGANGFCLKNESFSELERAIDLVFEGKAYISPAISRPILDGYLAHAEGKPDVSPRTYLTKREKDVLKLIGEGYKNKKNADLLCISPKTVEKHRSNMMAKLDLHNAQELTAYAIKEGLVFPKP